MVGAGIFRDVGLSLFSLFVRSDGDGVEAFFEPDDIIGLCFFSGEDVLTVDGDGGAAGVFTICVKGVVAVAGDVEVAGEWGADLVFGGFCFFRGLGGGVEKGGDDRRLRVAHVHALVGEEFGFEAFVSAVVHPVEEGGFEGGFGFGEGGVVGEVDHVVGVVFDVVEFFWGAGEDFLKELSGGGVGFGLMAKGAEPVLFIFDDGVAVAEFVFRGEVEDVAVGAIGDGADAEVVASFDDAAGGLNAEGVFLSGLGGVFKDGEEAGAIEVVGNLSAGGFDEGGDDVVVFGEGGGFAAGFNDTGPVGDEGGFDAVFVAGPFGEGEGVALFAEEEEEGVFVEGVVFELLSDGGDLGVEELNFGEVVGEFFAEDVGLDVVFAEGEFVGGEEGTVTKSIRTVGLVGANDEAEGLVFFGAFPEEFVAEGEVDVLCSFGFVAEVFERVNGTGADVAFANEAGAVAEGLEVVGEAFDVGTGFGVVRVGAAFYRVEAVVEIVPGGRAHGCGLVALGKAEAVFGELVDVGGDGVGAAVAGDVAVGAIVSEKEDEVGSGSI